MSKFNSSIFDGDTSRIKYGMKSSHLLNLRASCQGQTELVRKKQTEEAFNRHIEIKKDWEINIKEGQSETPAAPLRITAGRYNRCRRNLLEASFFL